MSGYFDPIIAVNARQWATSIRHRRGTCVRFSPNNLQPTIVSSSWDKTVKIWNLSNCKLKSTLAGHSGYVNTVAVSPDGSLCASGGKDGVILLWDLAEGKKLYSLDAGSIVHALCFSPNRYWLCAATEASIKIWDLESKTIVVDLKVDAKQEAEMAEGGDTQSSGVKNKVYFYFSSVKCTCVLCCLLCYIYVDKVKATCYLVLTCEIHECIVTCMLYTLLPCYGFADKSIHKSIILFLMVRY